MSSKTVIFEDISKHRNSRVWKYYLFDQSTYQAKCQLCFKQLAAKGSSTKNLLDHLVYCSPLKCCRNPWAMNVLIK